MGYDKFMRIILFIIFCFLVGIPSALFAQRSSLSISAEGDVALTNMKVIKIAGSTLFGRTVWGQSAIPWTIRTDKNTTFFKETGTKSILADVSEGDYLDIVGKLLTGGDILNIEAEKITNHALVEDHKEFQGVVSAINLDKKLFVLLQKSGVPVAVRVGGTTFLKGKIYINFNELNIGDRILSVSGTYNIQTKELEAEKVLIFQDTSIFKPRLFTGVIESIGSAEIPTTISLKSGKKTYTLVLNDKTEIINKARKPIKLSRFEVGDFIRIWGAIRETDLSMIDVEVARNMEL